MDHGGKRAFRTRRWLDDGGLTEGQHCDKVCRIGSNT
jgi:hypothetical protein